MSCHLSHSWRGARLEALGIATAAALFAFVSTALAQTGSFAGLAGSWSGGGTVALAGGPRERITCRAHYTVSGTTLRQTLRCASESYRFDLSSNVEDQGGQLSGNWAETSRNIQGVLYGRVQGNRMQVNANGPGFMANVSLVTEGDRQSVTVNAQGSESAGASIMLKRSR